MSGGMTAQCPDASWALESTTANWSLAVSYSRRDKKSCCLLEDCNPPIQSCTSAQKPVFTEESQLPVLASEHSTLTPSAQEAVLSHMRLPWTYQNMKRMQSKAAPSGAHPALWKSRREGWPPQVLPLITAWWMSESSQLRFYLVL